MDPRRQSIDGRIVGTIDYMAPEQAVGGKVGEASDWYSVGVILYEALTGRVPYGGHAMQVLVDKQQVEAASPLELAPGVPEDLARLAQDLLAIEPARRPTGADIADRLGIVDIELRRTTTSSQVQPSSVFVGRDDDIERLVNACERTRRAAEVHLVVGESGIGKSSLVEHATTAIVERDPAALVLRARCYERESVPYKAFDGIADGLTEHLASAPADEVAAVLPERAWLLPRLFPVLQRVPAIAAQPAVGEVARDPLDHRRQTFAALRALFVALASHGRVVLTIDDLQWADPDSYVLLNELLREPAPPRILVQHLLGNVQCLHRVGAQQHLAPAQQGGRLAEQLLQQSAARDGALELGGAQGFASLVKGGLAPQQLEEQGHGIVQVLLVKGRHPPVELLAQGPGEFLQALLWHTAVSRTISQQGPAHNHASTRPGRPVVPRLRRWFRFGPHHRHPRGAARACERLPRRAAASRTPVRRRGPGAKPARAGGRQVPRFSRRSRG